MEKREKLNTVITAVVYSSWYEIPQVTLGSLYLVQASFLGHTFIDWQARYLKLCKH